MLKKITIAVNKLNGCKYSVFEEKADRVVCYGEVVKVDGKKSDPDFFRLTHASKKKTFLKKFVDIVEVDKTLDLVTEMYHQHKEHAKYNY